MKKTTTSTEETMRGNTKRQNDQNLSKCALCMAQCVVSKRTRAPGTPRRKQQQKKEFKLKSLIPNVPTDFLFGVSFIQLPVIWDGTCLDSIECE